MNKPLLYSNCFCRLIKLISVNFWSVDLYLERLTLQLFYSGEVIERVEREGERERETETETQRERDEDRERERERERRRERDGDREI